MPVSRSFLYTSSRVPSKGAPLQVFLTELPQREREREREREKEIVLQSLPLHILQVSQ